mgnify:CR=1 FL=1
MSFWSCTKDVFAGRRPIGDIIGTATKGYRTIRVAVMGSKASGKTVFLTSLANHLQDHRPTDFPLGGRIITWDKYAIVGESLHGIPLFRYDEARGLMSCGEWPEKTTSSSILALRLLIEDKDGNQENVQLEVVDVPGERIADFAMKRRSYKDWSLWMQRESATAAYGAYVKTVKNVGPNNEEAIINAYRDFMTHEYEDCAPCITPSVVKLGVDGTKRGGRDPAAFRAAIASVPIGFTDEKGEVWEFVPLPELCFAKNSPWHAVVKKFARGYDRYVKQVVRPIVDWMEGAEKLFYLVDVLSLLQLGASACDSERQYGEAAISAFCPRRGNIFSRMGKWAAGFLWKPHINTVYVVATKADCVWSQENRDNLVLLADALFGRAIRCLDKKLVKSDMLPCAAVCSTKERLDGQPGLQGKIYDPDNPKEPLAVRKWKPSNVPSALPRSSEEWEEMIANGKFNYQFAFPWFDTAQICPPRQLNLDVIAEAMLAK